MLDGMRQGFPAAQTSNISQGTVGAVEHGGQYRTGDMSKMEQCYTHNTSQGTVGAVEHGGQSWTGDMSKIEQC